MILWVSRGDKCSTGYRTKPNTHLLLGSLSVRTNPMEVVWSFNSTARAAPFFSMSLGEIGQFVWGDVIKGIEQTAANVTASMLNMDLGLRNSTCLYAQTNLIYIYHQPNLWIPYGVCISFCSISELQAELKPSISQIALFIVTRACPDFWGTGIFTLQPQQSHDIIYRYCWNYP